MFCETKGNFAPTLFIIATQLVAEAMLTHPEKSNVSLPSIKFSRDGSVMLMFHDKKETQKIIDKKINMLTYADDGALSFNKRNIVENVRSAICDIIVR